MIHPGVFSGMLYSVISSISSISFCYDAALGGWSNHLTILRCSLVRQALLSWLFWSLDHILLVKSRLRSLFCGNFTCNSWVGWLLRGRRLVHVWVVWLVVVLASCSVCCVFLLLSGCRCWGLCRVWMLILKPVWRLKAFAIVVKVVLWACVVTFDWLSYPALNWYTCIISCSITRMNVWILASWRASRLR